MISQGTIIDASRESLVDVGNLRYIIWCVVTYGRSVPDGYPSFYIIENYRHRPCEHKYSTTENKETLKLAPQPFSHVEIYVGALGSCKYILQVFLRIGIEFTVWMGLQLQIICKVVEIDHKPLQSLRKIRKSDIRSK